MAAVQGRGPMWPQTTSLTIDVVAGETSHVKALTEFTGRDTARGCKGSEFYYRLQIRPSHI